MIWLFLLVLCGVYVALVSAILATSRSVTSNEGYKELLPPVRGVDVSGDESFVSIPLPVKKKNGYHNLSYYCKYKK